MPTRPVDTAWVALQVSCLHPHWVRFTTSRASAQDAALRIHRVRYSFGVALERAEIPADHCQYVVYFGDDTWYLDRGGAWWSLRRFDSNNRPTPTAQDVVRHELLPALVEWLHNDAAADLLTEGESYWRAGFDRNAATAETLLMAAVNRVRELRGIVRGGQLVSPSDERYVRTVNPVRN